MATKQNELTWKKKKAAIRKEKRDRKKVYAEKVNNIRSILLTNREKGIDTTNILGWKLDAQDNLVRV